MAVSLLSLLTLEWPHIKRPDPLSAGEDKDTSEDTTASSFALAVFPYKVLHLPFLTVCPSNWYYGCNLQCWKCFVFSISLLIPLSETESCGFIVVKEQPPFLVLSCKAVQTNQMKPWWFTDECCGFKSWIVVMT